MTLGDLFPGQVIVAGRSYEKAGQLSVETQGKVLPMAFDISHAYEYDELLDQVAVVIMCLDQSDTRFVEKCIQQGIHYIDITASYELLSQVEMLEAKAKEHGSTVVLSVGLAPGLTNLLASYCKSVLNEVQRVDIYIVLGLGEAHGKAAIRWTLENLNAQFLIKEDDGRKTVRSFAEAKAVEFPEPYRMRLAYRFNFADQHVIMKTLGIESASTWFCFDSPFFTRIIAMMRKVGLSNVLRLKLAQDIGIRALRLLHPGSDDFCIKVEASTTGDGKTLGYECLITGRGEGRVTGLVTAHVAERLYRSSFPAGIFRIEQLFQPLDILEAI
ncbi:saccharopine dehydrogenase NADP-binding domain-containing protein [Phototrophicus methaneseepsis]|uniref:Saccharopine dehydrogenase NADP-binding domain-containing protein n=1 Tax=Phototrophicus methaneseepsis TaxID=2710758 RepID=A0A7S8EA13_9CHLR|nr:saccharopine dehydrogenase NADP-binding domain-containing protein [Phototrophicus methaneseepsis]QPC83136.1 saccharopine dehydrogenase NADP-binding domain-containing protein [Phototrophicus methaneseepsis]